MTGLGSWFDVIEDDRNEIKEGQTDIPDNRPEPDGPLVKELFEQNITAEMICSVFDKLKDEETSFEFGGEIISRESHLRENVIKNCEKLIKEISETVPSNQFKHVGLLITEGNGLSFMDAEFESLEGEIDVTDLTWEDWMGMHIHPVSLNFMNEEDIAYTLLVHMTTQGDDKDEVNGRVAFKVLMDSIKSIEED